MPPEAAPRLLSATEETILREAWKYKYLRADDFQVLLGFRSLPHTRGVLSRLCGGRDFAEAQYLLRAPMPTTRVGGVAKFYGLGSRGVAFLSQELGVLVGSSRPHRLRYLSFSHLTHALLLSRFVIALERWSLMQSAFSLVETRLSYDLAADPAKLPVIPDAWLLFERAGKKHPLWIEIDNSSQWFKQWSQHLKARLEFLQSGAYAQAFPETSGAVLIAYAVAGPTPHARETRRDTLRRWTMAVLSERGMEHWAGIFKFTTLMFDEIYEQGIFERTVWYRPDADKALPLLTP